MICQNALADFLNICSSYLLCEEENIEDISQQFLSIDNNQEKLKIFLEQLDEIKNILKEDLLFFMDSDPAVESAEEIKIAYPGYKAIVIYRLSHILYGLGYKVEARIISELGHSKTGIDIHPAAEIGYPFFIDHGTGIVIGETASVGKKVKLYQGVTLGALSINNASSLRGIKRHPSIGDNITIYANASILGPIQVGDNVVIGGNVFLTEDVPSNTQVSIGKPVLVYKSKQK